MQVLSCILVCRDPLKRFFVFLCFRDPEEDLVGEAGRLSFYESENFDDNGDFGSVSISYHAPNSLNHHFCLLFPASGGMH